MNVLINSYKTKNELGAGLPAPSPGDVQNIYKDRFQEVQNEHIVKCYIYFDKFAMGAVM